MVSNHDANREACLPRVNGYGKLTRQEEVELFARWKGCGDLSARDAIVRSQMRTVVTIARMYRVQAATLDELISEGNYGLVQALDRFEPARGTRFVTYAVYWVRAHILAHLARSRTLVSTGIHSKLLAKLKREKARVSASSGSDLEGLLAGRLGLSREKLRRLEARLSLCDVPFIDDGAEGEAICFEASSTLFPSGEDAMLSAERSRDAREALSTALERLDPRERYIMERRLMADDEEALSLAALGRELGVSPERARQLEARAKLKVGKMLDLSRSPGGSPAAA